MSPLVRVHRNRSISALLAALVIVLALAACLGGWAVMNELAPRAHPVPVPGLTEDP